jgi:hypothetical protein
MRRGSRVGPFDERAASAVVAAPIISDAVARVTREVNRPNRRNKGLQNETQKSIARLQRRLGRRVFHHRR